jgi:hypothetical protein
MSILQKLTEGVQSRDLRAEGAALLNKWETTGLLEGLNNENQKQGMAVLLENQAKELLREASSMAAGDVEGFAAVAFPIVRRVFGGLIANDLVSVQPMSLPSGLIFFLDFTHEKTGGGAQAGESVFGGNIVGKQVTGGIKLAPADLSGPGGHYDLGNGASAASSSFRFVPADPLNNSFTAPVQVSALSDAQKKLIRYDADILADTSSYIQLVRHSASMAAIEATRGTIDRGQLSRIAGHRPKGAFNTDTGNNDQDAAIVRRLTFVDSDDKLTLVLHASASFDDAVTAGTQAIDIPLKDHLAVGGGLGSVVGGATWALEEPQMGTGNSGNAENKAAIAEIDIKVDSIAVTAQTKKLKAKWSPELGQDLNAYHNLDAEVELTGILSEQIALEIDRELLGELVSGATAGTRYWSRAPGLFVDANGVELGATSASPDFTGTVSEWYETLIETINDVSAQIHRKTLRGGANFVVCSPEVANILEFTSGFRASVTADQDRGTIGAVKAGSLSKKFDVYVDPYFLRNVILVGRKGSSFLESGFVYAPYVPLQVTPTIFGTEDFVPRKGVMTRYAKKMVRPDMYGLVIVRGLLGEAGAS